MAALEAAKNRDFVEANNLIKESNEALHRAHVEHTKLLADESRGEDIKVTLLMVHASNHLSIAELSLNFVQELIALYHRR